MKAIKFIVVPFLFISLCLAREIARSSASSTTLIYENCSPECNALDLDVTASDVKKSETISADKEEQQKNNDGQGQRLVRRRKVRRKFRKGRKGRREQGLSRQDYGDEGGKKLQHNHADAYQKRNEEGAKQNNYATYDEARAHKTENQQESYSKSFFRDLTNNKNKFYDVYDEGGYHKKGEEAYSSYNDSEFDKKLEKQKHKVSKEAGEGSRSDYDKLKAISENIAYGGKKGGEDFYDHLNRHGKEKIKKTIKKEEHSDGIVWFNLRQQYKLAARLI